MTYDRDQIHEALPLTAGELEQLDLKKALVVISNLPPGELKLLSKFYENNSEIDITEINAESPDLRNLLIKGVIFRNKEDSNRLEKIYITAYSIYLAQQQS
jgi:hypothetical protein